MRDQTLKRYDNPNVHILSRGMVEHIRIIQWVPTQGSHLDLSESWDACMHTSEFNMSVIVVLDSAQIGVVRLEDARTPSVPTLAPQCHGYLAPGQAST